MNSERKHWRWLSLLHGVWGLAGLSFTRLDWLEMTQQLQAGVPWSLTLAVAGTQRELLPHSLLEVTEGRLVGVSYTPALGSESKYPKGARQSKLYPPTD